jgi:nicotinate-nucleotide adenylyltransferase
MAGLSAASAAAQRLGIFGGTFDPPHHGHLILAQEAHAQLALGCVLWVLTPDPPHKAKYAVSPFAMRLELLQAALSDSSDFEYCPVDAERPPPHYAVDTLHLLRRRYPAAALVYLMGSDSLRNLPNWNRPQAFIAACDELGVMLRPGPLPDLDELESALPGLRQKVRYFRTPLLEIASSQLRRRITQGQPYRYFVPEPVYRLIQERRLYQDGPMPP